jgi:hypothetical protein
MGHHRLDEPVPREEDIGLRGDGLGELEEDTGGLGEALCREEDGVLQFEWQSAERPSLE